MTRKEVWEQASKQHGIASVMDRECDSYIFKGIKIMKCDGLYRIFNTKMKGDFYQEITEDQYEMFETYGFEYGVYNVMTDNLQDSLKRITNKIQIEVGPRRKGDIEHSIANVSKFKKNFNWKPKFDDLKTILATALDWEKKI